MLYRVDITDIGSHVRLDIAADGTITVVDPGGCKTTSLEQPVKIERANAAEFVSHRLLSRWLRGYHGGLDAAHANQVRVIVSDSVNGEELARAGV